MRLSIWMQLKGLADRPFAGALAFLLLASAITTLAGLGLNADVLETLVPEWMLQALALTYGLGGLLLMIGMMWRRGNWEAAGCVLIMSGLAVRLVAIFAVLGFTPQTVSTGLFYLVFAWACGERFRQILDGDQIIRVHKRIELKFEPYDKPGDADASG